MPAASSGGSDGQAQLQAQAGVHQEERQDGRAKVGVQAAGVGVVLQWQTGVDGVGVCVWWWCVYVCVGGWVGGGPAGGATSTTVRGAEPGV